MAGLLAIFAEFEREICGNALELAWPKPGRVVSGWAGP